MRKHSSETHAQAPWHVPVARDHVAEDGQHFELTADPDVRGTVARLAGLRDLPRLEAKFDVTRHGASGLRVAGHVSATVGQNCVVTLEPLANEVEEDVNVIFSPPPPPAPGNGAAAEAEALTERKLLDKDGNEVEPLIGGIVDLGALATEFLILGLDPYPRKPGAVFEAPPETEPEPGPFAALAKLTKGGDVH
jgi:uncharacterized metal-binding protein YceD (DUF177 family)